jgi:hypothetical protein
MMRIVFPVVSPQKEGAPLGYGEVFIGEDKKDDILPYERFAVENALHAWALLFPREGDPRPLSWRAHPNDPSITKGSDAPSRWHGASANLATLLAMAHAVRPFRASWLNTSWIWASAQLSTQGGTAHLHSVDFLQEKLEAFLQRCKDYTGEGRAGIFLLPAVAAQRLERLLESPLAQGVQVETFDVAKPPRRSDDPLILFVRINQLPALIQSLRRAPLPRYTLPSLFFMLFFLLIASFFLLSGWKKEHKMLMIPVPRVLAKKDPVPLALSKKPTSQAVKAELTAKQEEKNAPRELIPWPKQERQPSLLKKPVKKAAPFDLGRGVGVANRPSFVIPKQRWKIELLPASLRFKRDLGDYVIRLVSKGSLLVKRKKGRFFLLLWGASSYRLKITHLREAAKYEICKVKITKPISSMVLRPLKKYSLKTVERDYCVAMMRRGQP